MKSSANYKKRSKRSRGIKRRAIVLAVLLVAVAAVSWAFLRGRDNSRQPQVTAATPSASPALPLRPVAVPWTGPQRRRLSDALNTALAPAGAQAHSFVVLAEDGTEVFGDDANRAVIPASVQKLLIAATALSDLGPDYRYHTIFASGAPPSNGTIGGDLWLAGSGDPSLRSRDLRAGAAALAAQGVSRIEGGVSVDASAIAGVEINPNWDPDDAGEDFQTAVSGISIDGDTVEFDVRGEKAGSPAGVDILPGPDVAATGEIDTSSGDDSVVITPGAAPNSFKMSGDVPEGSTEKFWLPVHDITAYAGAVLDRILNDAGITTGGPPRVAVAPLWTVALWEHTSLPLRVLERHMLFHSDNHYAEQLLRTVGGATAAAPDDSGGIAAVRAFLARRNIPVSGLKLLDGSGLAAGNRVAASTLAGVLAAADGGPAEQSLYTLLPGRGQGTLKYYDFTTASGRVRAKSGHIGGVSSLAGYVDTPHHGRVCFAFMLNGATGDADAAIVQAVDRLATF